MRPPQPPLCIRGETRLIKSAPFTKCAHADDHADDDDDIRTSLAPATPFQEIALTGEDPDAWDDSALISAYDRAVSSHRLASAPPAAASGAKRRRKNGAEWKKSARPRAPARVPAPVAPAPAPPAPAAAETAPERGSDERFALELPPPPPALLEGAEVNDELRALLASWYEAGFRAGSYARACSCSCLRPGHRGVQ